MINAFEGRKVVQIKSVFFKLNQYIFISKAGLVFA